MGGPLGVVGFYAYKCNVYRPFPAKPLHVGDVQGTDFDRTLFFGRQSRKLQAVLAHVFDMLGPGVNQRDIVSRARHVPAGITADGAGAYHYDTFTQFRLRRSKLTLTGLSGFTGLKSNANNILQILIENIC
jgi:hypothetical protein